MSSLKNVILSLIVILCLTGCWNRVEVNDIAVVTAMGVDKIDGNRIRLSLQIGVPATFGAAGNMSGNVRSTFNASETGVTLSDAYRRIQEKLSRRIFLSHSRVLIIGEKSAKDGVSYIIDFFARYQEPRVNALIVFTNGEASEFLKSKPLLEKVPSEETREIMKQGIGLKVSIKDFWDMLISDGVEPVAPRFKLVPLDSKNDSGQESSASQIVQAISGAAVFKKDKLIGWMNASESRGILHLRNELDLGVITVNIPEEKGGGKVSVKFIKADTDFNPYFQDGQLKMAVKSRSKVTVLENASPINLSQSKELAYIETKLEESIKQRMELALAKAQKQFRSDIFGFGRIVYQSYPKQWNNSYKEKWDTVFPDLEVTIKAKVSIKRIGLSKETK
ncbi:Ger(x)C family spore germination protein [Candidatus Pristimantibacillus sp. PTI5]|uniref:Ger(x)C family spore germination protein n=1 Tax=Candidatus Pristimantibacillus sp. PTI5 TaxID=3400422 RepID=UPI003B0170F5